MAEPSGVSIVSGSGTDSDSRIAQVFGAFEILFEFPYAPPGGVDRLDGKEALAAYLPGVAGMITIDTLEATAVHPCLDPEVVIIKFVATGQGKATGLPYDQRYISVVRVRDGRIIHYRDYWNPLVALAATGGGDALTMELKERVDAV